MKFIIKKLLICLLFMFPQIYAQDIELIVPDTFLQDTLGSDIAFKIYVINQSSDTQMVFLKRTINILPHPDWTSSLCFGQTCYAPFIDSVATDGILTPPLAPGDTLDSSIHVFPFTAQGTATLQVQVGTFADPGTRYTYDFTAEGIVTSVDHENGTVNDYQLGQNYPNPFNPSTRINYNVGEPGLVQLKVYNVLGIEVASLVNEFKNSGNHSVDFRAETFSSGVYFYSLSVNNFTQTRKMILEK